MKDSIRYFFCGLAMGAADVVPGVSGGTVAYLAGIYETLLSGIASFDAEFLRSLLRREWNKALHRPHWSFLLPLISGILISIFSLARLIVFLLQQWPELLWAFFFGLILSSIGIMAKRTAVSALPFFIAGVIAAWLCTGMESIQASHGPMHIFLAGFIALCAMILPGISGSFMLVLLGQYYHILQAVIHLDMLTLIPFALGGICGLLIFSRALSACFRSFPIQANAAMIGVMTGCLRLVWPWKDGLTPTLPLAFGWHEVFVCAACITGMILPLLLHVLTRKNRPPQKEMTHEQ